MDTHHPGTHYLFSLTLSPKAPMYSTEIHQLSYQALLLILILSGPPILISTALGLCVAIFQAATQIQEQTLSSMIKLVSVVLTLLLLGGWLSSQIMEYTTNIFVNFPKWSSF